MKEKTENILIKIVTPLTLIGFATAGWFFAPFIVKSGFARLILILVSCIIPISYFLIKFIYKREVGLLKVLSTATVLILAIFPFSQEFFKLNYEHYYTSFVIPFFLNASIIFHDIYEENLKNIEMVIDTVSNYIRYFPLSLGGLLIFTLLIGNITPPWDTLPIERKSFLIFKIGYYIVLAIAFWSIRKKFLKGFQKAIPELIVIISLFFIYFIVSMYLFQNSNYLGGSYFIYLKEIVQLAGMSTLGIYLVILIEIKQKNYTVLLRRVLSIFLYIYGFLVIIPILLDIIDNYINIFISFNSFIFTVAASTTGSVLSGLVLHFLLKKNKSS